MTSIAIFQVDLNIGGIQKSLINLLNNLDYKKVSVDLYLFSKDNLYINDIPKEVNVIYLKRLPAISKVIYFNILNTFYKKQVNKEYDIAIDYDSYSMDTSLGCINCNAKKKVVYVHNDIILKRKEEIKYRGLHHFFKSKYKHYDKIVGVSSPVIDSFKKVHKLDNKQYFVIPNLINTKEIFDKKEEKIDLKLDNTKYNLCSTGRLVHQKGFDILLVYIKELIKYRKDFHLYIIGGGPLETDLNKMIKDFNIEEYVTMLGYQKNPFAYMDKMDGFVLTSRYEGQGMVFLEAKALGLDIVLPKHLEKYVPNLKGCDDVIEALSKLKKHPKKYDDLKTYNTDSISEFYNMLKK